MSSLPLGDLSGLSRLIVVAAHPDDETLGCGGLIAQASRVGVDVRIIAVTDGSASHPRSTTVTGHALSDRRALELRDAVGRLAPAATITWLGFPDGRTADFVDEIGDRLRSELGSTDSGTLVTATWSGDRHRDHRIVGELVERAVPTGAAVWCYPVWMWHWASPDDASIPWRHAVTVQLSADDLDRKRDAIDAFASQLVPLSNEPGDERVLEPGVLEHFDRDRETFFVARGAVTS